MNGLETFLVNIIFWYSTLVTLNSIVLWISLIVQNWMVLEMEVSPKKPTFQPLSLDWSGCWHRYFYQGCYGTIAEDLCILHQLLLLLPLWCVSLLVLFVSTGTYEIINMPHIFLRIKLFCFFKIVSWNFQHLIDLGFREPSQNFSSFGPLLFFRAY